MNGPYLGLMRPFVCIPSLYEFIPSLRRVDAQDELHGLPAYFGEVRLMWHRKSGRTQADHDRGYDPCESWREREPVTCC